MLSFRLLSATAFALVLAFGSAAATPQAMLPDGGDGLVIRVQDDCHADVRRHYLPRFGREWHRHGSSNCRVILVDPLFEEDDLLRDCHRDVRRHYLPDYDGTFAHRHVGQSCRVSIYRRHDGDQQGGNCIRFGPITYCEN